jgi:regulator of CtrA degradation
MWQGNSVTLVPALNPMTRKLVDSLHVEAMVLSDEARSYFDSFGLEERMELAPTARVIFSCEALKVTTRLMHSVAWLLGHRARLVDRPLARTQVMALGRATPSDPVAISALPAEALRVIAASEDIYARIGRLEASLSRPSLPLLNPAAHLQQRLQQSLEAWR